MVGLRIAALALVAVAMMGCAAVSSDVGSVPAESEARGFLARIVAAAQGGDFAELCSFGDPSCADALEGAGRDAVPPLPPTVAGTRVITPTANRYGGLVFQLCGIDGRGQRYATEMLVLRSAEGLKAIQPVFWSGMRIAPDGEVGPNDPLSFPGCP